MTSGARANTRLIESENASYAERFRAGLAFKPRRRTHNVPVNNKEKIK